MVTRVKKQASNISKAAPKKSTPRKKKYKPDLTPILNKFLPSIYVNTENGWKMNPGISPATVDFKLAVDLMFYNIVRYIYDIYTELEARFYDDDENDDDLANEFFRGLTFSSMKKEILDVMPENIKYDVKKWNGHFFEELFRKYLDSHNFNNVESIEHSDYRFTGKVTTERRSNIRLITVDINFDNLDSDDISECVNKTFHIAELPILEMYAGRVFQSRIINFPVLTKTSKSRDEYAKACDFLQFGEFAEDY